MSFSTMKRSDRLRATGWSLLAVGIAAASVFYWMATRTADPALDDVAALGYTRSLQHGMGVMMGPLGAILTDWQQILTTPVGKALMIVVAAALLAAYFFRVAWVLDSEEDESV